VTVPVNPAAVLHARFDADDRLIAADPALAALNARAGGQTGAPLALPQLATAVRLARRLGIVVSRGVVVADDDADIEMWARAQPDGGGVRLAVSGWQEVAPALPRREAAPPVAAGDGGWRWETDAALRLTLIAPEAGRQHGFDPFALLGRPLTALFDLEGEQDGMLPILAALAARTGLTDQPARLRPNGASMMLSATIRPDADGGFAGFIGIAQIADAPAVVAPGLPPSFTEALDRALRAPLGRIVAHADSINAQAEGPITGDYAAYAADIASAGRHLLGLVDDLVDLQALERPDFAVAREAIDLADLARRAAGLLGVRAAQADVRIDRPGADASVAARGDFRRVLQILMNLLGNALRYSPPGEVVTIGAEAAGDLRRIVVADRGKGIAAADQVRVFEKFGRIDPSEPGGSGLGLYIARRLARAMDGDLTVESTPGEGARFILTLPA
jgi:signal transduction histidine kinase